MILGTVCHQKTGGLVLKGFFYSLIRRGDFQIVGWDTNGNLTAESIHQYGTATKNTLSKHYSDQAILFSNKQMKPSWIELDSIKKYLSNSYNPIDYK